MTTDRAPHVLWALVLVATVAVAALAVQVVGAPSTGPISSSNAVGPGGLSQWASLLSDAGHPIARTDLPLDLVELDPSTTVVLLDVPEIDEEEVDALRTFVQSGGRLIAGGAEAGDWLPRLAVLPATRTPLEPVGIPAAAIEENLGVREVETVGDLAYDDRLARPVLACRGGVLVSFATVRDSQQSGRELLIVADASMFQNRLLGVRDNARAALQLVGEPGRPVIFAEANHGFTSGSGLAAVPPRVLVLGLLVVVAAIVLARSRRPLAPAEEPAPTLDDHVALVARRMASIDNAAATTAWVAQVATDELAARGRADEDPVDVAIRLGLAEQDVRDLLGRHDDHERRRAAAGRVLARTTDR